MEDLCRSARTSEVKKIVRERIRRNPQRSMRGMAKDLLISPRTMRRVVKEDLGLKIFRPREVQLLSDVNRRRRLEKSLTLRERFSDGTHLNVVFSDEKIFTVEISYNRQNYRIIASDRNSIPPEVGLIKRVQKPASIMVWGGITSSGRTPLVFIEQGAKLNSQMYVKAILEKTLKPWAKKHFKGTHWVFQQDSAPCHKAKITQEWLKKNTPDFISPEEWPASSPDLNPMDFTIWSILEARVCAKSHRNIESLKNDLTKHWELIGEEVLRAAVENFSKRLSLCIKAKRYTFENLI